MRLVDVGTQGLRADVCIVGAGAAGLALAHALRDSPLSVLVVESGPLQDPAALNAGEAVGLPYNGLLAGRVRGLGGTTAVWPGQCMRLRPHDYASWPFDAGELAPWYDEAERLLGLVPGETTREPWELFGDADPGFDRTRLDYATAVFAPRKELASLDLGGATVVTCATVTNVAPGRLLARDVEGRTVELVADAIVLCAGALESVRLLLSSGFDHPDLGRFFQDHAVCRPARVVPSGRARALQDRYGMRRRGGRWYSPKLLLAPALQEAERVPGCMANVVFDYGDDSPLNAALRVRRALRRRQAVSPRDLGRAAVGLPQLASGRLRVARGREPAPPPQSIRLLTIVEQNARAESRLELADDVDPLGQPRLRVDWRLGEDERRAIELLVETLDRELRRTGAAELETEDWLTDAERWTDHVFDSFHPAGGARMGPGGVVDETCGLRGWQGVYVCGSAVFPASGCSNPTLTIVALALRLAAHLRES